MKNKYITKILATMIVLSLLISVLSGCSKTASTEGNVNTTYEEGMDLLTVTGKQVKGNDSQLVPFPVLGFAYLIPKSWGTMDNLNMNMEKNGISITVIPASGKADKESDTEKAIQSNQLDFIKTFSVPSDTAEKDVKKTIDNYQKVEKLATLENRTYYIAYNDTISKEDHPELTKKDVDLYASYAKELPKFRDNFMVFPIQKSQTEEGITSEQIKSIRGTDMKGKPVDSSIFEKYDLTMINIWATWCGPCVDELPDLASLYEKLPHNLNLITICADGTEEKETAEEFLKKSNAKFVTICGDKTIQSNTLKNVFSYPTTIFVDKNGDVVGEPLLGSWSADFYQNEITNRLK